MAKLAGALALWVSVITVAACDLGPVPFHCDASEQCVDEGATGKCEPTGFCSFPVDAEACLTEKMYGEHASEALSGQCVPQCVADIKLGSDGHGCLLKATGEVFCWGNNAGGRLGTGQSGAILPPTQVQGIDDITEIDAGGGHTCAVRGEGMASTLWCWGESDKGQAGVAGGTVSAPRQVTRQGTPLTGIKAFALGERHSCVLVSDGTVFCFGSNELGELGTGEISADATAEPIKPMLAARVDILAAGGRTTCVTTAQDARCWGANACAMFGTLPEEEVLPLPQLVFEGESPSAFAVGGTHICYVTEKTYCSGAIGTEDGQCTLAVGVDALDGEVRSPEQLVAGIAHSCLLYEGGEVLCWGEGQQGQVGPSSAFTGLVAVSPGVENEAGTTAAKGARVAAAGNTSCALTTAGRVVCWGDNTFGQLGAVFDELQSGALVDVVMDQVACP